MKVNQSSKKRSLSWSPSPFTALTGGRDALVRNGHAPNGKQLYCCRACGRQSRENPIPTPIRKLAARRFLHASSGTQPFAWPHPHVWDLCAPPCPRGSKKSSSASSLTNYLARPGPENPTSTILELDERMARLSSKKRTTPGFGLPCAARRGK